jgi:hypothetical protein
MKKIVSSDLIVYDDMQEFMDEYQKLIDIKQLNGEEVETHYAHTPQGNFFSALVLGRKDRY